MACANDMVMQNVLMVHGFPERKEFWAGLIRELDEVGGYCGVACDMHGYSPLASPDNITYYHSDNIRRDTFEIATALGFDKFHLVTHDHGAVLGWRMAGDPEASRRERIVSFTALSIPHLDAFSKMLFGATPTVWQQVASQYFTIFVLEDSASLSNNFWFNQFRCSWESCFESPADVQKAMWWYNGIFNDGTDAKLALPPVFTVEEIDATDYPGKESTKVVRSMFSNYTGDGYAQTELVGTIEIPTLYICGNEDTAILCSVPEAKETSTYCSGSYTYLEVECGHTLTACDDSSQTEEVMQGIIAHLEANTPAAAEFNV